LLLGLDGTLLLLLFGDDLGLGSLDGGGGLGLGLSLPRAGLPRVGPAGGGGVVLADVPPPLLGLPAAA